MFKQKPLYIRWLLMSILTLVVCLIFMRIFSDALPGNATLDWTFIIGFSLVFPALLMLLDKKVKK